jgi:glyoxylase-like metal-dependent hydrolase (beta-lactamase superfamily II)
LTIKQIRVGFDNFSYIIFCPDTRNTALVDPGYDGKKLIDKLKSNDLKLSYIIATHGHGDHTGEIKNIKGNYSSSKIIASKNRRSTYAYTIDKFVSDQEQIKMGNITLEFLLTPGHTPDGLCILVDKKAIITGDTLFIGDCGRVDLPGGSLREMYETLKGKIFSLSDSIIVYPGHDYGPKPFDTIGNLRPSILKLIKGIKEYLE